jgi:hypothetical protein
LRMQLQVKVKPMPLKLLRKNKPLLPRRSSLAWARQTGSTHLVWIKNEQWRNEMNLPYHTKHISTNKYKSNDFRAVCSKSYKDYVWSIDDGDLVCWLGRVVVFKSVSDSY